MDRTTKKPKIHFAWFVMVGLGLLAAGSIGSYTVLIGSFLVPINTDLGIDLTMLSYYFTAVTLTIALMLPIVGKVLPKVNLPVILTILVIIMLTLGALMSTFTQAWMFIVAAVIIGICMSFMSTVPISTIMDQWFKKKSGLAIGVVWSFTSVYMAIMSPIISRVIEAIGWRSSFLVLAAVSACLMLPSTIFLIRFKPSDKGMKPYGYEEADSENENSQALVESGVSFKKAVRSPAFFALVAALCLLQLTVVMNQLFPTYAEVSGFGPTVGALMVSGAMIFDMILNPIIGATCDRFGAYKAHLGWIAVSILSFVILLVSTNLGLPYLAILGAGINDVMYVICGVGIAALAMEIFGSKDYGKIFSYVVSCGYIIGSFGMPLMTTIYEKFGTFKAVFIVCIVINLLVALCVFISHKTSKKLPWENTKSGN